MSRWRAGWMHSLCEKVIRCGEWADATHIVIHRCHTICPNCGRRLKPKHLEPVGVRSLGFLRGDEIRREHEEETP